MSSTRLQAFYQPLIGFLPNLGLAAILLVGGRQVIDGSLTLGAFTAFYAYMLMLISPMRTLGVFLGMSQRAVASGARIFQILDRAPEMTVPDGAPALPPGDGHVELRGVTVTYEGTREPALRDVDLDVPAGATIALPGPTPPGKTTPVSLIPRLDCAPPGPVPGGGAPRRAGPAALL